MDMVRNNTQVGLWRLNDDQLVLRGPKVCQENIPHTITTTTNPPEPFHVYANSDSNHLNVAAEIETHQTRQRFSNLLLSNFGESVWIVASVSCS